MEPVAIEMEALIESVRLRYGLDLRSHPRQPLRRRLLELGAEEGVASLSELQGRVLRDASCFERLAQRASVLVTSPFRDPGFYLHLRQDVLPLLRTWPTIHAWVAGCGTGEDVWSLAIVLFEEGLAPRSRIYATDRSAASLDEARAARLPLSALAEHAGNHALAGGRGSLQDHFVTDGDAAVLKPEIVANVTHSVHDLAVDGCFNEFQLVTCRNVLPPAGDENRRRVLQLIDESLAPFGVLALDRSERRPTEAPLRRYEPLDAEWRTFRKVP